MALSGRCDMDALGLLLVFPEDGKSGSAVQEVCALPGPKVYSLIVSMSQNLNLRSFIYKVSGVAAEHGGHGGQQVHAPQLPPASTSPAR